MLRVQQGKFISSVLILVDGADMNSLAHFLVLLVATTSSTATPSPRCPSVVSALAAAKTFSSLVGVSGCLTPDADAFLTVYKAGDVDGFRRLAKVEAVGAQLYALCGLKHLHVDGEANELRKRLLASKQKTSLHMGCTGPGPSTAVSELVSPNSNETASPFDSDCDYLVENGAKSFRRACDSKTARPICR